MRRAIKRLLTWADARRWSITLVLIGFLVCSALDRTVYKWARVEDEGALGALADFRAVGEMPLWLAVALVLLLIDLCDNRLAGTWLKLRRAVLVLSTPAAAGIATNILKLVFRRQRPEFGDGLHTYRSFLDRPLDSGGLDLPSGHTTVAFAGAFVLCRLFPRWSAVWVAIAVLCGSYRVLAGAHFLSGAYAAGVVGFVTAALMWKWLEGEKDREIRTRRVADVAT